MKVNNDLVCGECNYNDVGWAEPCTLCCLYGWDLYQLREWERQVYDSDADEC